MPLNEAKSSKSALPRWQIVGWAILCSTAFVGFVGLILRGLAMVRDGRGAETYRTFWLVEFNWVGVLIMVGAAAIALLIAIAFHWREEQQWRALERKYNGRDDA
ncbi:MAG: hypothetical protein ABI580_10885 [Burkholderiaceae bacterium]